MPAKKTKSDSNTNSSSNKKLIYTLIVIAAILIIGYFILNIVLDELFSSPRGTAPRGSSSGGGLVQQSGVVEGIDNLPCQDYCTCEDGVEECVTVCPVHNTERGASTSASQFVERLPQNTDECEEEVECQDECWAPWSICVENEHRLCSDIDDDGCLEQTTTVCTGNEVCSEWARGCIEPDPNCPGQCTQSQCIGGRYQECQDSDGDGCRDFKTGSVCINGCNPTTSQCNRDTNCEHQCDANEKVCKNFYSHTCTDSDGDGCRDLIVRELCSNGCSSSTGECGSAPNCDPQPVVCIVAPCPDICFNPCTGEEVSCPDSDPDPECQNEGGCGSTPSSICNNNKHILCSDSDGDGCFEETITTCNQNQVCSLDDDGCINVDPTCTNECTENTCTSGGDIQTCIFSNNNNECNLLGSVKQCPEGSSCKIVDKETVCGIDSDTCTESTCSADGTILLKCSIPDRSGVGTISEVNCQAQGGTCQVTPSGAECQLPSFFQRLFGGRGGGR